MFINLSDNFKLCFLRFGAKLLEPAGYAVTGEIIQRVQSSLPSETQFWTGQSHIFHNKEQQNFCAYV